MSERELLGLSAAGGVAVGRALILRDEHPVAQGEGGEEEQRRAARALSDVAAELGRAAERLRTAGRVDEAEILEANRLMAEDPALAQEVQALAAKTAAASAVLQATERHAALLESLPDELLAARAADVRGLGRRAARLLAGEPTQLAPLRPAIVIARDIGPADMAELDLVGGRIRGFALAEGGATSHAAIMARALGLPLVVGLGDEILTAADGELVALDGGEGSAVLDPGEERLERALRIVHEQKRSRRRRAASRTLPAVTRDGRKVRLLCNASTAGEVSSGLAAGADGVGLLRTELAFLETGDWPTDAQHADALAPALALLTGRTATVRTLDFGADKTPPFLAGITQRGLALSLAHPAEFEAQLRAILETGASTDLRVLLPLVRDAEELSKARALLDKALESVRWSGPPPALGAMIETPEAASRADEIAAEADFLSIGTNDLVQYTLGLDRDLPLATVQAAADPEVLGHIAEVVKAARANELTVEVCGEAAGEAPLVVLLVGLGVDELSVAPARLDEVRTIVRRISAAKAAQAAGWAVAADSARQALAFADEVLSVGEPGHDRGELLDGLGGVVA
ncbi:MAG TPA: putative PEP-binding protein [Gaiellaceae bacterium]|nr:putative PEP-binding protein [Gaiellaceae bacterium]